MKQETIYHLLDLYRNTTKGKWEVDTYNKAIFGGNTIRCDIANLSDNENALNDAYFIAAVHNHAKDLIEMAELAFDMQKRYDARMESLDRMIDIAQGIIDIKKSINQDK